MYVCSTFCPIISQALPCITSHHCQIQISNPGKFVISANRYKFLIVTLYHHRQPKNRILLFNYHMYKSPINSRATDKNPCLSSFVVQFKAYIEGERCYHFWLILEKNTYCDQYLSIFFSLSEKPRHWKLRRNKKKNHDVCSWLFFSDEVPSTYMHAFWRPLNFSFFVLHATSYYIHSLYTTFSTFSFAKKKPVDFDGEFKIGKVRYDNMI